MPNKTPKRFKNSFAGVPTKNSDKFGSPSASLLPTTRIIEKARIAGVDFGSGDPTERIRYFIKLGILPHAIRKSKARPASLTSIPSRSGEAKRVISQSQSQKDSSLSTLTQDSPVGHLPAFCVKTLITVERLKRTGLSYPQIAVRLKKQTEQQEKIKSSQKINQGPATNYTRQGLSSWPIERRLPTINLFSKVGISEKELDKKLAKIDKTFAKKLGQLDIAAALVSGNIPHLTRPTKPKFHPLAKGALVMTLSTVLVTVGLFFAYKYQSKSESAKKTIAQNNAAGSNLGQVLAATSAEHQFYVDANSEFSGTTLFRENITAPNVLYGAVGGTGINVSAGQTPTISLDSAQVVTSVNTLAGALTVAGSGSTSVSSSGSTITISSSAITSESDTLATVTGRGASTSTEVSLNGGIASTGNLNLKATGYVRIGDDSATPDVASGDDDLYILDDLEFKGRLIAGASGSGSAGTANYCLISGGASAAPSWGACISGVSTVNWDTIGNPTNNLTLTMAAYNTTFNWDPTADSAETAFTLNFDGEDTTGTGDQDQVLLALAQSSNGTDVDEAADAILTLTNNDANDAVNNGIRFDAGAAGTDFTYGINFDAADIGTAEIVLENAEQIHNQSDGTITLEDGSGTDYVTFNATTTTLTTGTLALSTTTSLTTTVDLTIDSGGGDIVFADGDTINIGGSGDDVAFNAIGDDTASASTLNSDNDLYIEDDLEVDGTITGNVTGTLTGNASTATALAANGANCSAGSAPLGVDASGAAESCTDFEEDLANSAGLAAALSDETGSSSGGLAVFNNAPSITSPTITTSPTAAGATWTDLGSVTTVDINGGTVDGTTIGASSAAAGTFTNLTATGNITFSSAQILGGSPLVFEGTTDDNVTTILAFTDPTSSNKTITFPNATGTVAVSATSPITLSVLGDIGCASCIVSGGSLFSTNTDSASANTVAQGDVLGVYGNSTDGLDGIDVTHSGDNITISFDATEVTDDTWGSNADFTWTFDASGTGSPTIAFGDGTINATATTFTHTGIVTATGNVNANGGLDVDDVFVVADGGAVTANTDVTLTLAGTENFVLTGGAGADSATTNDLAQITLTTPVDTAGSNTHNALDLDLTVGNASGGTNSARVINIGAISGDAQVSLYGLNIGILTGTAATENAIQIATGWDDILNYNGTTVIDGDGTVIAGQITGVLFTTNTDSASSNDISQGDVLGVYGNSTDGLDGIDVTHSGDNITISFDATEVTDDTWGSNADFTWTFDASGTGSPTIAFGDGTINATATTFTHTGIVTATGNVNANGGLDVDDVFVVADGGAVTANTDVDFTFAGTENIALTSAPTVNGGVTTDSVQLTLTVPAHSGAGTNVHNLLDLDATIANATAGTNTANIINIGAISGDAQVSLYGLNIGILTGTAATENAIQIATGWDDILNYNGTTVIDGDGTVIAGQITGVLFTTNTDSASSNDISRGDVLGVYGNSTDGLDGIDVTHSGDNITISFDATEVTDDTWGSNADFTWTFDASGTGSPTIAFGDGTINATATTFTHTGIVTATGNVNANGGLDVDDVFVVADGGAVTANTDVDFTFASAEDFTVTNTTWTPASAIGLVDINTTSATNDARGIDNYFDVNSTAQRTQYGLYGNFDATSLNLDADTSPNYYGIYQTASKTGTDAADTDAADDITRLFALTGVASNTAATSGGDAQNVRHTYGLYASATGSAAGTDTTVAYGIYTTAASGDNNYGIFSTGADTANVFTATASTITTGVVDINVTSATDLNHGIDLSYTFSPVTTPTSGYGIYSLYTSNSSDFSTNYGIFQVLNDGTGGADTNIGMYTNINLTSNQQTTNYGAIFNITSTSTIGNTSHGVYILNDNNTALVTTGKSLYGITSLVTNDGITDGSATTNLYGGYFSAIGNTGGTQSAYGVYTTASGADNNYGIFSTGADTANVFTATASTITTGVVDLNTTTSSTNAVSGLNLSFTDTTTSTGTTSHYGIYNSFSHATAIPNTNGATYVFNWYGNYTTSSKSGADSCLSGIGNCSSLAENLYGTLSTANNSATGDDAAVRNTYGGSFSATGTINGTSQTYGIYTTATSADTNYALYINIAETLNHGDTTTWNNFGIYNLNTDSSTTNGSNKTLYGNYTSATVSNNSGDTAVSNAYGTVSLATATNSAGAGTINSYGAYVSATGNTQGTNSTFGIYTTASGGSNNYGIFSTGANSANVFTATASTITTGVVDINTTTSSTNAVIGADFNFTTSGNATQSSISNVFNADATGTSTFFGYYGNFDATSLALADASGLAAKYYGIYQNISKSGTDSAPTNPNTTTTDIYGIYSVASNTSGTDDADITRNTYGGYFSSTSSVTATAGFQNTYGVYITTSAAAGGQSREIPLLIDASLGGTESGSAGIYLNFSTIGASNITHYGQYSTLTRNTIGTAGHTYGEYITFTDADDVANTDYGIFTTIAASNNAAKLLTGVYGEVTSTSTAADTLYGGYFKTYGQSNTARTTNYGAIAYGQSNSTTADNVYGLYGTAVSSGAVGSGTRTQFGVYGVSTGSGMTAGTASNTYGAYFSAVGEAAGAGSGLAYGVFATASGGDATLTDAFVSGIAFRTASSTAGLCWDASGASAIEDCSSAPGDYAEVYPTENDVDYGEIVGLGTTDVQVDRIATDENGLIQPGISYSSKKLTKSSTPYQSNVIGVTSRNWADFSSTGHDEVKDQDHPIPVALSGRVPVKVTDEGGSINVGDLLTTSSTPGAAMKADSTKGSTIGKALSTFEGPGQGEIMMFVENRTSYNLAQALQNTDLEAQSFSTTSGSFNVDTGGNTRANSLTINDGLLTIDNLGNIATAGTLSTANEAFTVDALGNVNANSLNANLLNITGNAIVSGSLDADSLNARLLTTASIQTPEGQSLTLSLSDSNGASSLRILNSLNSELLALNSAGKLSLNAANASFNLLNGYICVSSSGTCNIASPQNGTIYAESFETVATADLAEKFPTGDESIEAGDIVAVDPNNKEAIILAHSPYDPTIIGIVSTNPGLTLNSSGSQAGQSYDTVSCQAKTHDDTVSCEESTPPSQPVALAGRVPVKVSTENGEIHAGDPITSSSTPGVGMRATAAGRVIGIALENHPTTQPSNHPTTIVAFVNPSWYTGNSLAANGSVSDSTPGVGQDIASRTPGVVLATNATNADGTLQNDNSLSTIDNSHLNALIDQRVDQKLETLIASGRLAPTSYLSSEVESDSTKEGQSNIDSPIPSPDVLGSSISDSEAPPSPKAESDSAEASAAAITGERPDLTVGSSTEKGLALSSDALATQTQKALDDLTRELLSKDLHLDTLTATGQSNLASTQVAGTFSQDGTLIIDYGRQINVLGSTLYLQNDSLSGCPASSDPVSENPNETGSSCTKGILVDIGNGRASFDKSGNLKISGTLFAQNVETKELTVYTDEGSAKTVGTGQIAAGKSQVTIFTTAIKPDAKILVTPTGSTGGKTLFVSQKLEFEGFTVALDGAPQKSAVEFDWLIINTNRLTYKSN